MGKISAFGKAAAQERSKPGSRFQSKPRKIKFLFNRLSEKTAFYGLAATAFLAVTLYGAVDGWAESLIVFLICAVALFRVAGYLTGSRAAFFRKETTSLLLPLIGILILAAIQIIPFGGETISEDVYATKRFILLLTALVIAFEILLFYTTSRKKLQTLTAVVIAAGVGSAILGVLREVAGTPENPFFSEYFTYETGFAQYVNRNHFMFLLEMSIGLLCGLTLKGDLNEKQKFGTWVLSGLLILVGISVNSRGGLLSLAGLFVMAFVLHFLTKGRGRSGTNGEKIPLWRTISKAAAVGVIVFSIGVLTVAFVGGDQVVSRIERIEGEVQTSENRGLQRGKIWSATVDLIAENPIFGVGFGAYGAAIPRFDETGGIFSLRQAHNDYLETLANGGIVALILVLIFGVLVARRIQARLAGRDGFERGSAFGAMLGIFAVLVHSMVEFGLHAFGNALMFIILIVIAAAKIKTGE